ncbi:hypothetical protein FS837_009474 [Tulasnella sp. UAMH 9824]|nr:hypothetical protein FS837_009474 [Tulasnella sp. UAMH 9824]
MATQAPVPPNLGQVVDDPSAPLRLQPLEQISDFWKRYDRLADIHDKALTSNLNGNLDVLLIFAALFSAINTAFISITMPDLSPSPSDETNTLLRLLVMRADNNSLTSGDLSPPFSPNSTSIIVNCLLYASLSCSLLAAVGAMMAKEWLQSFNRSGQTGPLEDQGKLRQRKFNGVEQWHLEAVIKFLPNLLILLGRILPQTMVQPISQKIVHPILRTMIHPILRVVLMGGRMILWTASQLWMQFRQLNYRPFVVRATSDETSSSAPAHVQTVYPLLDPTQSVALPEPTLLAPGKSLGSKEQIVIAQAACWLLRTTSFRADQVAVARFIRGLSRNACTLVFEDSRTWRRLLSLTCKALDIFDSQPSEGNREVAEAFGLALCHVPLPLPKDMLKGEKEDVLDLTSPQKASSLSEVFLHAVNLARAKYEKEDEERDFHLAFMSTLIGRGRMIQEYQWANLSKLFPVDENPRPLIADNLLGM